MIGKDKIIQFIIICLILLIALPACCMGWLNIKVQTQQQSMAILDECDNWFITEGLSKYYKYNDIQVVLNYFKEKDVVVLYNEIASFEDMYIASILLFEWSIGSRVICFERIESQNRIYEYWTAQRGSKRPDFHQWRTRFMIVEAESVTHPRRIIYESDKFFTEYEIHKGTKIKFPLHQIDSVRELGHWGNPESYEGTVLEGVTEEDIHKGRSEKWGIKSDKNQEQP